jgi:putative ABC transport system permease protein
VRKVLGALRKNLIGQFLVESLILNLIAFILSMGIVYLLTPAFNQLTENGMYPGFHLPGNYWVGFTAMFLGGSFYPASILLLYCPVFSQYMF